MWKIKSIWKHKQRYLCTNTFEYNFKTEICNVWFLIPSLTRAVLVFATERKNNVDPCLRSQTSVN